MPFSEADAERAVPDECGILMYWVRNLDGKKKDSPWDLL